MQYKDTFQQAFLYRSIYFICILLFIYIYIYAFSRRFYPKRLTIAFRYTFSFVRVFPGNQTHNLLRCWRNALPLSHRNTVNFYQVRSTKWIYVSLGRSRWVSHLKSTVDRYTKKCGHPWYTISDAESRNVFLCWNETPSTGWSASYS